MLITAAYAQAASASPFGGSDTLVQLVPIVAMIAIVYFILWRPQQRRAKEQREMVQAARRGDVVVTTGGLIGKVTKSVDDNEVEFELAPNVRVRLARSGIAEVRAKGEPVKDFDAARQGVVRQEGRAKPLTGLVRLAPREFKSPSR